MSYQSDSGSLDDDELFTYLSDTKKLNKRNPNQLKESSALEEENCCTEDKISDANAGVTDTHVSNSISGENGDSEDACTESKSTEDMHTCNYEEDSEGEGKYQTDMKIFEENRNPSEHEGNDVRSFAGVFMNQDVIHNRDSCHNGTQCEHLSSEGKDFCKVSNDSNSVIETQSNCETVSKQDNKICNDESVQDAESSGVTSENFKSPEKKSSNSRYIMLSEDDFLRLCALKSVKLPEDMTAFENVSKHLISPESSPVKGSLIQRKSEVDKSVLKGSKLLVSHMQRGNTCPDMMVDHEIRTTVSESTSVDSFESRMHPCDVTNMDRTLTQERKNESDLSEVEIVFVKLFDDKSDQMPTAECDEADVSNLSNIIDEPPMSVNLTTSLPVKETFIPKTMTQANVQDIVQSHCAATATSTGSVYSESLGSVVAPGSIHTSRTPDSDTLANVVGTFSATTLDSFITTDNIYTATAVNTPAATTDGLVHSSNENCEINFPSEINQGDRDAYEAEAYRNTSGNVPFVKDKISTERRDNLNQGNEKEVHVSRNGLIGNESLENNDLNVELIEEDCERNENQERPVDGDGQSETMSSYTSYSKTPPVQVRFERKNDKLTRVVNVQGQESRAKIIDTSISSECTVLRIDKSGKLIQCKDSDNSDVIDRSDINTQWKSFVPFTSYKKEVVSQEEMFSNYESEEENFELEDFEQTSDSSDSEALTEYFSRTRKNRINNSVQSNAEHCNNNGSPKPSSTCKEMCEQEKSSEALHKTIGKEKEINRSNVESIAIEANFSEGYEPCNNNGIPKTSNTCKQPCGQQTGEALHNTNRTGEERSKSFSESTSVQANFSEESENESNSRTECSNKSQFTKREGRKPKYVKRRIKNKSEADIMVNQSTKESKGKQAKNKVDTVKIIPVKKRVIKDKVTSKVLTSKMAQKSGVLDKIVNREDINSVKLDCVQGVPQKSSEIVVDKEIVNVSKECVYEIIKSVNETHTVTSKCEVKAGISRDEEKIDPDVMVKVAGKEVNEIGSTNVRPCSAKAVTECALWDPGKDICGEVQSKTLRNRKIRALSMKTEQETVKKVQPKNRKQLTQSKNVGIGSRKTVDDYSESETTPTLSPKRRKVPVSSSEKSEISKHSVAPKVTRRRTRLSSIKGENESNSKDNSVETMPEVSSACVSNLRTRLSSLNGKNESDSKDNSVTTPEVSSACVSNKSVKSTPKKTKAVQNKQDGKTSRKRKSSVFPEDITKLSGEKCKKKKTEKTVISTEIKKVDAQITHSHPLPAEVTEAEVTVLTDSDETKVGTEKQVSNRSKQKKLFAQKKCKTKGKFRMKHQPALMKFCDTKWKEQVADKIFEIESIENRKPVNVKKLLREILESPESKESRTKQRKEKKTKHKKSGSDHGKKEASHTATSGKVKLTSDSDDAWLSDSSSPSSFPAFKFYDQTTQTVARPTVINPGITATSSPHKITSPSKQAPSASPTKPSEDSSVSSTNKPRVSFNESVTKKGIHSPKLVHSPLKGYAQSSFVSKENTVQTDMSTKSVSHEHTSSLPKIPGRLQASIDKLRAMLNNRARPDRAARNIQFTDVESQEKHTDTPCTSTNQS